MLSLSTSWNIRRSPTAHDAFREVRRLGLSVVELSHVCRGDLECIFELVRRGEIVVSSIHSPCGVHPASAAPRCFSEDNLASTDEAARRSAVDAVKRSIEAGVAVGARAVVVHLGFVAVDGHAVQRQFVELHSWFGVDPQGYRDMLARALDERRKKARPNLDAAMRSLCEILPVLDGTGMRLAIENRDYYHQIPNQEEMRAILSEFRDAPIGYWHDVGHEEIPKRVGWLQSSWLPEFAPWVVGCHLHDVIGFRDHLVPGRGEIDFVEVLRKLPSNALKVIEVNSDIPGEDILGAYQALSRLVAGSSSSPSQDVEGHVKDSVAACSGLEAQASGQHSDQARPGAKHRGPS
ncbi:MAG TPA: TIM barrel protein [Firmicutes bacterium]|nr:TIM barrel protein [Bacillota bacterium]